MEIALPSRFRSQTRFLLTRQRSSLYKGLSMNIAREVCEYLHYKVFASILFDQSLAVLLDLGTGQTASVRISSELTSYIGFCQIESMTLLCVGGEQSKKTKTVSLETGAISSEADLSERRCWPGVIAYGSYAYVFGGNVYPMLKSAEKFNKETRQWTRCPDMLTERACFTPCEHRGEIYLVEASKAEKAVEVFTPATELYRRFPICVMCRFYGSVAFVANEELYLFTYEKKVCKWLLGDLLKCELNVNLQRNETMLAHSPVVVSRNVAYWADHRGNIVAFDTQTHSFSNVTTF